MIISVKVNPEDSATMRASIENRGLTGVVIYSPENVGMMADMLITLGKAIMAESNMNRPVIIVRD